MKKKMFVAVTLIYFFVFFAPQTTYALYGVADTNFDFPAEASGFVSAGSNTVTAGSSVTTAVMTTLEKVQHYILNPLAWFAAKKIIQNLTAQTVNWINSGFQGNPAYVQDPERFFLGIADNVVSRELSTTKLSVICSPFRAQVRIALVENYLRSGPDNYSCSLSKVLNNYDRFINDFNQGGWDAWYEVTQINQNNPLGAYNAVRNNITAQIGTQQSKYVTQLQQGRGFLSYQRCPKGKEFVGPALPPDPEFVGPTQDYRPGDCLVTKETVTPGSVIETQLQNILPTGIKQLELADSFNEIVGSLITQMFSRVVGGGGNGGGLNGASSGTITAPTSLTTELATTEAGPTSNLGPTLALNGPRVMTVRLGYIFRDPGAVAYDNNEGDLTDQIIVTNNSVGGATATCRFEPLLKAIRAADAARLFNAVALTRWQDSADKTDGDRLGDLSTSAREVVNYFKAILPLTSILNPGAPEVNTLKQRFAIIIPSEELIGDAAQNAQAAQDNLSQGYATGKVMEATLPLRTPGSGGAGLMDDIYNTFVIIRDGIASNPSLYCSASGNPAIGDVEGTYTIQYFVSNSVGLSTTTTRTVIVSATAPLGQNAAPIDTLTGGPESPGGGGGGGSFVCDATTNQPPVTPTDPVSLALYVNASYRGWTGVDDTPSDIAYWVGLTDHYGQYSNGRCYIGWNAYMEQRIRPGNNGSSDPNLASQPPMFLP